MSKNRSFLVLLFSGSIRWSFINIRSNTVVVQFQLSYQKSHWLWLALFFLALWNNCASSPILSSSFVCSARRGLKSYCQAIFFEGIFTVSMALLFLLSSEEKTLASLAPPHQNYQHLSLESIYGSWAYFLEWWHEKED